MVTRYTTQTLITNRIGALALEEFTDHADAGSIDTTVMNESIDQASDEINLFVRHRYGESNLDGSTLIEKWATDLACFFVFMNRGNPIPESFMRHIEYIRGLLERVNSGELKLPNVTQSQDFRPTMSNRTVDRRYTWNTIRVTRQNSSDAPTKMKQDWATFYPFD